MRIRDQNFLGALSGPYAWRLTNHPAEEPMRARLRTWQQALQQGDMAGAQKMYGPRYPHQGPMAEDPLQAMLRFCGNQAESLEITPVEATVEDTEGTFLCTVSVLPDALKNGGQMQIRHHTRVRFRLGMDEQGQWSLIEQDFI